MPRRILSAGIWNHNMPCSFCGIGPTTSQNRIRFSFLRLEDEDGKLTQARDLAVLSWIQRCKKQIPDNSPVLRIIQNRTFKDPEEEKYIPISLYELILRQLAFQNSDILNGLNYYNRQCDK